MTARAGVWKRKREGLQDRRNILFKKYQRSPSELRLALQIKAIDDQIAECTRQLEQENQRSELGWELRPSQ
jgi:superfamily I DNA and RNA helicase